jgi:site-specific DNA-cytosine methylase
MQAYAASSNALPETFARIIAKCAPKCVVFEQVPLFKHTSDYQSVMKMLGESCVLEGRVLHCAQFSVPQQRRRLIVVGVRKGVSACGAVHLVPAHRTPVTVAEALAVAQPALGVLLYGMHPLWARCGTGCGVVDVHVHVHGRAADTRYVYIRHNKTR